MHFCVGYFVCNYITGVEKVIFNRIYIMKHARFVYIFIFYPEYFRYNVFIIWLVTMETEMAATVEDITTRMALFDLLDDYLRYRTFY